MGVVCNNSICVLPKTNKKVSFERFIGYYFTINRLIKTAFATKFASECNTNEFLLENEFIL